ncbi:hypothetical protein AB0E08_05360 [Streptomyces sp. NPDC048281]|uniref:hypothetical protein n=1 Tax=Streptomyces sp. NPDC048281 TaxID=3154715 RepID=UPI00343DA0F6
MTHRARPRVHLLAGGPAWEERRSSAKAAQAGFTKKQKATRKPLNQAMGQLAAAVNRGDWHAARIARAAAWDEVDKLNPDLTREERKKLWEYKQRILAADKRSPRGEGPAPRQPATETPRVWVRPPELDRLEEQRKATAAKTRAAAEEKRREKAARKAAAKAKAAGSAEKKLREVRVTTSVRTVSGGLPTLGKRH